jgi:drug/metabolite transporter (DMT)-like permease
MTVVPAFGARRRIGPYGAALGAILCWASLAAALGHSLQEIAPEQVLFYGMSIAGVTLATWDSLRGRPLWRTWPGARAALWGLYGIFGYHALLVFAFSWAPQVQANILNYTWPLWIIVLGSGRRLALPVLLGGLLGLAGVALVIAGRGAPGAESVHLSRDGLGLAFALGAGFCWGSFTVGLRRVLPAGGNPMAWFCLLAAAASAVLLLARGGSFNLAREHWPILLYIGLVPLGLAFGLWGLAAGRGNLQVLGLLSYFTPPLSTLLLAVTSGTRVGWPLVAGLALILTGSALGGRALRRSSPG